MIYDITPVPKPRMTQRDKWAKRPSVLRYRAFCDECRLKKVDLPSCKCRVIFRLPMPQSWSKKKKKEYDGKPHTQKPDWDNLAKALCDALYEDDSGIWDIATRKLWAHSGSIEIQREGIDYECKDKNQGDLFD